MPKVKRMGQVLQLGRNDYLDYVTRARVFIAMMPATWTVSGMTRDQYLAFLGSVRAMWDKVDAMEDDLAHLRNERDALLMKLRTNARKTRMLLEVELAPDDPKRSSIPSLYHPREGAKRPYRRRLKAE